MPICPVTENDTRITNDCFTSSIANLLYYHNIDIFDFEYPLCECLKPEFENAFIEYYYFSEIAYDMPEQFKQRLRAFLLMRSGYYNKLFEISAVKYNPLINKQLKHRGIKKDVYISKDNWDRAENIIANVCSTSKADNDERYKGNEIHDQRTLTDNHWTEDEHALTDYTEDATKHATTNVVQTYDSNIDTTGTLDHTIDTTGTLDHTIDTTGKKDATTNVVSDGKSNEVSHLEESTTSNLTERFSDTPQNDLATQGTYNSLGQFVADQFGIYLTTLKQDTGNTTHVADSTKDITTHQITDTVYGETTEGNETKAQNTTGNEVKHEDTTGNKKQDDTTETDTIYDEKTHKDATTDYTDNTIHQQNVDVQDNYTNDGRYRKSNQGRNESNRDDKSEKEQTSRRQIDKDRDIKDAYILQGLENKSISDLLNEWREATQNTLQSFVLEFRGLFMGILR